MKKNSLKLKNEMKIHGVHSTHVIFPSMIPIEK